MEAINDIARGVSYRSNEDGECMVVNHISESSISLADLRSRRVPVEWFEGVAVIQELCRVLVESGGDPEHASLAPQGVVIDKAGSVRVIGNPAPSGEPVVRRVGELLQMSLANSAFPVPLRLVMMQSVATPPSYASLAELTRALEYFERPDRTGLIRAVYERAQTYAPMPDVVEQSVQTTRHENAPLPRTRRGRRVSTRAIGASVAVLLMMIAIGVAVSQVSIQPQGGVAAVEQPTEGVSEQATPDVSSPKQSPENGAVTARVVARPKVETDVVAPRDSAGGLFSTSGPATIEEEVTGLEPHSRRRTRRQCGRHHHLLCKRPRRDSPIGDLPAPSGSAARRCSRRRALDHRVARRGDGTRRIGEGSGAARQSRRGPARNCELERRQDVALSSGGQGWATREVPNTRAGVADNPLIWGVVSASAHRDDRFVT